MPRTATLRMSSIYMGCVVSKKTAVEPRVISPVPPLGSPQVQPGLRLNLFTVSEEISAVEESEQPRSEMILYPKYRT